MPPSCRLACDGGSELGGTDTDAVLILSAGLTGAAPGAQTAGECRRPAAWPANKVEKILRPRYREKHLALVDTVLVRRLARSLLVNAAVLLLGF